MSFSELPLSYCTNVHPGQTVAEIVDGISTYTAAARDLAAVPVAAGLWLSGSVVQELRGSEAAVELLAQTLWQHDLNCYTLNTFPFGNFHSERVKEQVYLPDWTSPERILYTEHCASLLAQLLPEGSEGSLSTVPLGGRMNPQSPDFRAVCFASLIRRAKNLDKLHQSTGRLIRLAVEPEPMCELSGTDQWSLPVFRGLFSLADSLGCEDLVRKYSGLCFDVCHQAVEFEDVSASIESLDQEGVRINKVHITNAIELADPAGNESGREMLKSFVEPRYLHQTCARYADGRMEWRDDLTAADLDPSDGNALLQADALRVHFHVPVYADSLGPLRTTRADLIAALKKVSQLDYAPHLEVETHTWPVMPGEEQTSDQPVTLQQRIARELQSAAELIDEISGRLPA